MEKKQKNSKVNSWLVVGVIVLIVLLVIWLTMADLWGDTDVAAQIASLASTLKLMTV